MGLDSYILRVRKVLLNKRKYLHQELFDENLCHVSVENFESEPGLYEQLRPYVVKTDVECEFYDVDKMIADYNLPKDSHIWKYDGNGDITIGGYDENGDSVDHIFTYEKKKEYVYTKIVPYYCWKEDEVEYWRKNYDLQDWIYDNIEGVDNCGYYVLDLDVVSEINYMFDGSIPTVKPSETEALFYHEWY